MPTKERSSIRAQLMRLSLVIVVVSIALSMVGTLSYTLHTEQQSLDSNLINSASILAQVPLVQAALQEITQNYREASLSNVARAYGVSLAYVSECVRAQTGRTYKELLQKHRMETAARLLRRSDLNIQQIIAQVGYENTSYFYRLFHERYGLSPREYRLVRTGTAPRRPTA